MESFYVFTCPHCQGSIIVERNELNCRIFRHGVYKQTGQPIPPHAPKEECDRLVTSQMIDGCGKPFRVEGEHETIRAIPCDYI